MSKKKLPILHSMLLYKLLLGQWSHSREVSERKKKEIPRRQTNGKGASDEIILRREKK